VRLDERLKSRLLDSDGDWPAYLRYWVRVGSGAILPVLHRGDARWCPCCDGTFDEFIDFRASGYVYPRERCPRCGSLQRQRLLWLFLERETDLLTRPVRVLHVAPDYAFYRRLHAMRGVEYRTADLQRSPMVPARVDITAMGFDDTTFDLVMCSHVLEHVSDDRRALAEMRRVLKPGGLALLQHPIADIARTDEDPAVTDPDERLRRWGQSDHVRAYGRDYVQRIEEAGFDVTVHAYQNELPQSLAERCRLDRSDADDSPVGGQDIAVCRVRG